MKHEGIFCIGTIRSFSWEKKTGMKVFVHLMGQRVELDGKCGLSRLPLRNPVETGEDKLESCSEAEAEWLQLIINDKSNLSKSLRPIYIKLGDGGYEVREHVEITSVPEIMEAIKDIDEKRKLPLASAARSFYGFYPDEKGNRVYTKLRTRLLTLEEINQLGPDNLDREVANQDALIPHTFDDILSPSRLRSS